MNRHKEALEALQNTVEAVYISSKIVHDMGYQIYGRTPKRLLSEEQYTLLQTLIDNMVPPADPEEALQFHQSAIQQHLDAIAQLQETAVQAAEV